MLICRGFHFNRLKGFASRCSNIILTAFVIPALTFYPFSSSDAFSPDDQVLEMKLTGQATWSFPGSWSDFQFFFQAHADEMTDSEFSGPETNNLQKTASDLRLNYDPEFNEKIRESSMPNKASRPVFRLR